jgi:hypothetical protein
MNNNRYMSNIIERISASGIIQVAISIIIAISVIIIP